MTVASLGLPLTDVDPALAARVRDGMGAVEAALREAVQARYPFVTETSQHLVAAGGKRLRPLLTLLAAEFGDPAAAGVVPAAVVVELTHLATLYHDDVMDEATLRRGAQSANSRWTNTIAILTGDFLFARASDILADLGPEAVRIQARTFERLVMGQIRETVGPTERADPVEHYLSVVAEKTGSLIATSARFGAMLAGAPAAYVEALAQYGEIIGVAFQLSDDLIDIAADSGESGKTPGTDLREGVRTLPVLYALASADPRSRRLRELLTRGPIDDDETAEALLLLRESAGMAAARDRLAAYADEARCLLADLPVSAGRQALESFADYVVARTR